MKVLIVLLLITVCLCIVVHSSSLVINSCDTGHTPLYETNFFMQPDVKCSPKVNHLVMYSILEHKVLLDKVTLTIYLYDGGMNRMKWRYRMVVPELEPDNLKYVGSFHHGPYLFVVTQDNDLEFTTVTKFDVVKGGVLWARTHKVYDRADISMEPSGEFAYMSIIVKEPSSVQLNFNECADRMYITTKQNNTMVIMQMSTVTGCITDKYSVVETVPLTFNQLIVADSLGISTVVVCGVTETVLFSRYSFEELFEHRNATPQWSMRYPASLEEVSIVTSSATNVAIAKIGNSFLYAYHLLTGERLTWVNGRIIPDVIYSSGDFFYAYYSKYVDEIGKEYYGYI